MDILEIGSLVGLFLGALMGLGSLISPAWAAGVVRLQPVEGKPGGYSEFRATYGGLLLLTHLTALVIMLYTGPYVSIFVALPLALGWFGAALGRAVSLLLDAEKNGGAGMIPVWIPTEILLGVMIGLPILGLMG